MINLDDYTKPIRGWLTHRGYSAFVVICPHHGGAAANLIRPVTFAVTQHPWKYFSDLQQRHWLQLRLLDVLWFPGAEAARRVKGLIDLAHMKQRYGGSQWFDMNPNEVMLEANHLVLANYWTLRVTDHATLMTVFKAGSQEGKSIGQHR